MASTAGLDLSASYGVKQFVFRGEWHFFKFPLLMFGSIPVTNFWEDRPADSILQTLTKDEKAYIGTGAQLGLDAFFTINQAFFSNRAIPLERALLFRLVMARTDLYTTIALLKFLPSELWNALYHGHQAAEKSLKAYLLSKGVPDEELRKRRHDLATLLEDCGGYNETIGKRRALLPFMTWKNDWRYTPHDFPKEAVVNMFDCAMILLADVVHALVPSLSTQWPSQVAVLGDSQ